MANEWKIYKFGDIAELRKEQITPNGENLPYIGLEHIEQQNLRLSGLGSSNNVISNKFKFYAGDILYGKLRPYFRKAYKPKFDGVCSTDIFVIKNKKNVDKEFLYYLVATEEFTGIANSGSSGTRMPRADWNQLAKSKWPIPANIQQQKEIAFILSSLDEKIELNLELNKTLEAIGESIFTEWFTKFNFPGFDGSFFDGIPIGWRKSKLNEILEVQHGFAFKGEYFSDFETENILLTPGNFRIGGGFNDNKFKFYSGEIPAEFVLSPNDLIVTMTDLSKAGDTLGYSAIVPEIHGKRLLHNQRIGKIIFKSPMKLRYYSYWLLRQPQYRNFVLGSATGSTVKHTSPTRICEYEAILPDQKILKLFEDLASALLKKEQENYTNIRLLTKIRDGLLSKLVAGKIKIKK